MTPHASTWPTPLAEQLRGQGPMPFRDLMAEALYAPKWGYYTRRDLHPARDATDEANYMMAVAAAIAPLVLDQADGDAFHLVEAGAGSGRLTRSLLRALSPEDRTRVRVTFIEPRLARRTRLLAVAHEFGVPASVVGAPRNVEPGPAFVVAKELFSAFPAHWLERTPDGWGEVHVTFSADQWTWAESLDTPPPAIQLALPGAAAALPEGARLPVHPQLTRYLEGLRDIVTAGCLVIVDHLELGGGGVSALHQGEPASPYDAPGETRIIAAVDPILLEQAAGNAGWDRVDVASIGAPLLGARVLAID